MTNNAPWEFWKFGFILRLVCFVTRDTKLSITDKQGTHNFLSPANVSVKSLIPIENKCFLSLAVRKSHLLHHIKQMIRKNWIKHTYDNYHPFSKAARDTLILLLEEEVISIINFQSGFPYNNSILQYKKVAQYRGQNELYGGWNPLLILTVGQKPSANVLADKFHIKQISNLPAFCQLSGVFLIKIIYIRPFHLPNVVSTEAV